MYIYLSKILPVFVMPLSVVIVLLLLALLLLRAGKHTISSSLAALAVIVLWVASTPLVARSLYGGLESRYPPVPVAELPAGGCAVVLGGSVAPPLPPRVDIEFSEAVDRVYKTAQLFRAGKVQRIIATGGNQPWSESPWEEAELVRDLLVEWGVPEKAVYLEGSSRNTRENALYSKNIIASIPCPEPLLVTSAAHMPRAVATFRSVGVNVVPVSTDVRVLLRDRVGIADFLPSAAALAMTSDGLREWLGHWVYSLQGWN